MLYAGWNACESSVHVLALGSKWIDPNPLAVLAIMLPVVFAVASWTTTLKPLAVSNMWRFIWSPLFMKKSLDAFRLKELA